MQIKVFGQSTDLGIKLWNFRICGDLPLSLFNFSLCSGFSWTLCVLNTLCLSRCANGCSCGHVTQSDLAALRWDAVWCWWYSVQLSSLVAYCLKNLNLHCWITVSLSHEPHSCALNPPCFSCNMKTATMSMLYYSLTGLFFEGPFLSSFIHGNKI